MRWYEIHQSELIRARLREADGRVGPAAPKGQRPDSGVTARSPVATAFGAVVGWFARG